MKIEELFKKDDDMSIKNIIEYTKHHKRSKKYFFLSEEHKFGSLTLDYLLNNHAKCKMIESTTVEPFKIVASSGHAHMSYIPLLDFYKYYSNLNRFKEHFSKSKHELNPNNLMKFDENFFFSNISESNHNEYMRFKSFNDISGKRRYVISHGHHRSITANFLQMIDYRYRLKDVTVEYYTIRWKEVNIKRSFFSKHLTNSGVVT